MAFSKEEHDKDKLPTIDNIIWKKNEGGNTAATYKVLRTKQSNRTVFTCNSNQKIKKGAAQIT